MITDRPVDSVHYTRGRATAGAVQNPHGHDGRALGDPVRGAGDGAGDVGAVTVAVLGGATDCRVAGHGSAGELRVAGAHPGVDDVGLDPGAGTSGGELRIKGQGAAIESIKAPRRATLGAGGHRGAATRGGCCRR